MILNRTLDFALLLVAIILSVFIIYIVLSLFIAAILFLFEAHSVIALYTEDITSFEISNMFQYYLFHSMAMSVYITLGTIIGCSISIVHDKYKRN